MIRQDEHGWSQEARSWQRLCCVRLHDAASDHRGGLNGSKRGHRSGGRVPAAQPNLLEATSLAKRIAGALAQKRQGFVKSGHGGIPLGSGNLAVGTNFPNNGDAF